MEAALTSLNAELTAAREAAESATKELANAQEAASQSAAEVELLKEKLAAAEKKAASAGSSGGVDSGALEEKDAEISRLEGEVEQWMSASEQLQTLGEEAVQEITYVQRSVLCVCVFFFFRYVYIA
jgi:chromosome segregation ATPase